MGLLTFGLNVTGSEHAEARDLGRAQRDCLPQKSQCFARLCRKALRF
jgi:hypothetical protein